MQKQLTGTFVYTLASTLLAQLPARLLAHYKHSNLAVQPLRGEGCTIFAGLSMANLARRIWQSEFAHETNAKSTAKFAFFKTCESQNLKPAHSASDLHINYISTKF